MAAAVQKKSAGRRVKTKPAPKPKTGPKAKQEKLPAVTEAPPMEYGRAVRSRTALLLRRLAASSRFWGFTLLLLTLCAVSGWRTPARTDVLRAAADSAKTAGDGTGQQAILVFWLAYILKGCFGFGYMLVPFALLLSALILLFHKGRHAWRRAGCVLLLPPLEGLLAHLFLYVPKPENGEGLRYGLWTRVTDLWESGQAMQSGGVVSGITAQACEAFFSKPVSVILFAALFVLSFVVALRPKETRLGFHTGTDSGWERPRIHITPKEPEKRPVRRPQQFDFPLDDEPVRREVPDAPLVQALDAERDAEEDSAKPVPLEHIDGQDTGEDGPQSSRGGRAALAARTAAVTAELAERLSGRNQEEYRFPPLKLLQENRSRAHIASEVDLYKNSDLLENTLASFGVAATPSGTPVQGPAVTRYEFTLEQGIKLSKVTNLSDDIALALGAVGVRIAPIPNRNSVVGIEVPNRQVTPVLIRDVLESKEFTAHRSATAFAVGKDIGGRNVVGSIEDLPHVLVAGTTGSGKSVCTNTLIISLLYKSTPAQVRFIMVDPKMVELAPYNGIPHLLIPVVTDPRKAAGALQWAVVEMMRRYRTFSQCGVKKLSEFNHLPRGRRASEMLPSVVVVVDELADLMMAAAKEVEESIVRIAQMGRAAGIHLVISTQRPSADVITGLMKANIPSRIAFAVASSMESRIILDTTGAEKLVGRGDMLYAPLGEARTRVQGCYISPAEIERVVAYVKQTSEAHYDNGVMETIDASVREKARERLSAGNPAPPEPAAETDEMLPAAVDVVMETGTASVSLLQRRLKLGYSRAARLIDQMEERDYVGPFEGSKPRQIKISKEQWEEIKKKESYKK